MADRTRSPTSPQAAVKKHSPYASVSFVVSLSNGSNPPQSQSFIEDTLMAEIAPRAAVRALRKSAKKTHQRFVLRVGGERRRPFRTTGSRLALAYSRIISVNARSPAGT
jgi:hypothetical protein